jgi:energy-coupling factor transport system permease protein
VLTRALAAGALDRAVDLASALEVRGYGSSGRLRAGRDRSPWSRHDRAFAAGALATMMLAVGARLGGVAGFDPYPSFEAELGPAEAVLVVGVIAAMLAPLCADAVRRAAPARREREALELPPRPRSARV